MRRSVQRVFALAMILVPCLFSTAFAGPGDDDDGDGLTNGQEAALGSDPDNDDTDGDGWDDYVEYAETGTDLLNADTDFDATDDPSDTDPFDPGSGDLDGGDPATFTGAPTTSPYAWSGRSPSAGVGVFANSGALRRDYRFGWARGVRPAVFAAMDCCPGVPSPAESSRMDFALDVVYLSTSGFDGSLGFGMFAELLDGAYAVDSNGDVRILREDGVEVKYVKSGSTWTTPAGMTDTLTLSGSVYTRTAPDGTKRTYQSGVLDKIEDRFGNTIDLTHTSGKVSSITDTRGQTHTVGRYSGTSRVSYLTTADGARWDFRYNPKGQLMRVEGPASDTPVGGVWLQFLYVNTTTSSALNGNLLQEVDGRGVAWLKMLYDSSDRVTSQQVGSSSQTYEFDYTNASSQSVTITDRAGNEKVVEWSASSLALTELTENTNRGVRSGEGNYVTTFTNDSVGYLLETELPNGNGVKLTRNSVKLVTEERRKADMGASDGSADIVRTWSLDSAKYYAPSSYTDERGNTTTYTLNSLGQPTSAALPDVTHFTPDQTASIVRTFNGNGTLASVTDGEGYDTAFAYYTTGSATGYLWTVTVDDGGLDLVTEFTYTGWGDVATVTDPRGNTTTRTVQRYGNVSKIESPSALGYETRLSYDGNLNVTKVERKNIDWDGSWISVPQWITTNIGWTAANRPQTIDEYVTAGSIRTTTLEYDLNDNLTARERDGVRSEYVWDERDLLYQRIGDPGTTGHIAATETFTWDGNRHLTSYQNARGKTTTGEWDLYDRREKVVNALGHYDLAIFDKSGHVTERKRYEEAGATDTLRAHQKNHYDELGRLWKQEDLLQGTTDQWLVRTFTHDRRGLMTAHNDRRGYDTLHEFDGAGRLIEETDAAGNVKELVRDANGNVTQVTETEKLHGTSTTQSFVTNLAWDALNRLVSQTVVDRTNSSNTLVTEYKLDALNFLRRVVEPAGNTKTWKRDLLGRRTEERVALGGSAEIVTAWTWSANDTVVNYRDDKNNDTAYGYDALARLVSKTYEDTSTVSYTLDANGNATRIVDQNGTQIDQGFDDLDRLIGRDYTLASGVAGITSEDFAWDALNRITEAKNNHSIVQWTYDSLSRVTAELQGPNPLGTSGMTVTSSWDAESNLTEIGYPSSFTVTRTYAEIPMLTDLEDGSSAAIASFQHWGHHRAAVTTFGNGATATADYDGFRRKTSIVHEDSGSVEFAGFTYGYDANGNPLYEARSHQSAGHGDVYAYDGANRLTKALVDVVDPAAEAATPGSQTYVKKLEYNMDDVHNLTSYVVTPYGGSGTTTSYTTNVMNLYTAVGAASPTYDANGNLKDDGTRLYKYDGRNRLIEVRDKATNALQMTAKFDAVGFGRRFEKTAGGVTTRTIYRDEDAVEEYEGVNLARSFVYADGLDQPVMMEAPDEADVDGDANTAELQRFYFHTQLIGTVTHVTDAREEVVESYRYDPYGKPTIKDQGGSTVTTSPIGNPWLFTARQWDAEVALYHYRARAYSPELRRFIQRDPLEYVDGANAVAYVRVAPTRLIDPLGLGTPGKHEEATRDGAKAWGATDDGAAAAAQGSVDADSDQSAENSWKHSQIDSGGEGPATQAEGEKQRDENAAAWLEAAAQAAREGRFGDAYWLIGNVVHWYQDWIWHRWNDIRSEHPGGMVGVICCIPGPNLIVAPLLGVDPWKAMINGARDLCCSNYQEAMAVAYWSLKIFETYVEDPAVIDAMKAYKK